MAAVAPFSMEHLLRNLKPTPELLGDPGGLEGKFRAPLLVEFLRRLLKQVQGKVCLIVDGHPVHKSGCPVRRVIRYALFMGRLSNMVGDIGKCP